jgi:hypothetical protein
MLLISDKRFDSITGELMGGMRIGVFDRLAKLFASKAKSMTLSKMNDANMAVFDEELREIKFAGLMDVLFILLSLFVGAFCMIFMEDWSFHEGLYWAAVTVRRLMRRIVLFECYIPQRKYLSSLLFADSVSRCDVICNWQVTTVGFGDVYPVTMAGKIFCIFYVLICCSLTIKGFRSVVCYPLVLRAKQRERHISAQFSEDLSEETLKNIMYADLFKKIQHLQRDKKEITKAEFCVLMLSIMDKIEEKDIMLVSKIFDKLDTEDKGESCLGKNSDTVLPLVVVVVIPVP